MTRNWEQRPEGGSRFMIALIRGIARYAGRGTSRLLLYPITLYFLIVRGPERRASRAYLTRVFGRPATLMECARHIHCFASTILDRVFLLSGQLRAFDIRIEGVEQVHALLDQGRGVLLFGSHLGSFESLRVLSLERPDVELRVVMDRDQNAVVTQMLEALSPAIARTVIDASQGGTGITLAISEATQANQVVGLLVDRAKGKEPRTAVPFLGQPADFPSAPWLIAAALRVPVVLVFGLYRGGKRYDLRFETFEVPQDMPRSRRRAMLAVLQERYAQRLEHHVRSAPYNWFNFYDFWNSDATEIAPAPVAGGVDAGDGVQPHAGGTPT
jgi:predicted LPLAT superfamily acyltransferase